MILILIWKKLIQKLIYHIKKICDWADKKKYLNYYRILNFYVRHGMVAEKNHNTNEFVNWRYIGFNTQKRNKRFWKGFLQITQ